jgi:hypothetical protein
VNAPDADVMLLLLLLLLLLLTVTMIMVQPSLLHAILRHAHWRAPIFVVCLLLSRQNFLQPWRFKLLQQPR